MVEIQTHGSSAILNAILEQTLSKGARLAQKGEFTKRAFLNKRMDLSQAEAVADIIHSKTSNFAKVSVKNLSGVLKEKINEIRNEIFEVLSRITAGIDFPEDVAEPEYSYLVEKFETEYNGDDKYEVWVVDADNKKIGDEIAEKIRNSDKKVSIRRYPVGPVVGAHCGPGTVGIIFVKK